MMRILHLTFAIVALALSGVAEAQDAVVPSPTTGGGGEPITLPVRVAFFSSSPSNPLDSAAVVSAAHSALFYEPSIRPEVLVASAGTLSATPPPDIVHVAVELDAYSDGDLRMAYEVIGTDGTPWAFCAGESKWSASGVVNQALSVSHKIRGVVQCMKHTSRQLRGAYREGQ